MYRLLLIGVLCLAGCQNTAVRGPFAPAPDRVDDSFYTIGEQQRRGRERLSLPEDDVSVSPPTFADRPGPHGR
jgi:hypothetical protein